MSHKNKIVFSTKVTHVITAIHHNAKYRNSAIWAGTDISLMVKTTVYNDVLFSLTVKVLEIFFELFRKSDINYVIF